jgi:hypothetical protein
VARRVRRSGSERKSYNSLDFAEMGRSVLRPYMFKREFGGVSMARLLREFKQEFGDVTSVGTEI